MKHEMAVEPEAVTVLRGALGMLMKHLPAGAVMSLWGQRAPERYGCICLEEALRRAGSGEAVWLIQKVIGTEHIWIWNDTPGRTLKDVEDVISAAVELAWEGR